MLPGNLDVLTGTAYPVSRQDRHFYLRLLLFEEPFSLLRKASNAITRLPKAHNNVNMPMKIERISKTVIHATFLSTTVTMFFSSIVFLSLILNTLLSLQPVSGYNHISLTDLINIFRDYPLLSVSESVVEATKKRPLQPLVTSPLCKRKDSMRSSTFH